LLLCVGLLASLIAAGLRHFTGGNSSNTVASAAGDRCPTQSEANADRTVDAVLLPFSRENAWERPFARIEGVVNEDQRDEMWSDLAARIPFADIPATLDELQQSGHGDSEFFHRLVRRWARTDGGAAAVWAGQLPVGTARDLALSTVAIEWAGADLKAAAAWAEQLSTATEQQTLLLAISNEAVRSNPMEALRLVVGLPAEAERDDVIRRATAEWALQDAAGAVGWAKQIGDETLRSQVLAAAATAWSDSAPESAAVLVVQTLPSGRLREDTVVSIVQRWAQQQPLEAAAWVELFPVGALRDAAVENLSAQWALQDAASARDWLDVFTFSK
jgi:hypothetical protein